MRSMERKRDTGQSTQSNLRRSRAARRGGLPIVSGLKTLIGFIPESVHGLGVQGFQTPRFSSRTEYVIFSL